MLLSRHAKTGRIECRMNSDTGANNYRKQLERELCPLSPLICPLFNAETKATSAIHAG
jgi:hypothetical protein